MNMTTTTTICFSRDKAYSDALTILRTAHDAAGNGLAEDLLMDASIYLLQQWNELQDARMTRMRSEVTPKP